MISPSLRLVTLCNRALTPRITSQNNIRRFWNRTLPAPVTLLQKNLLHAKGGSQITKSHQEWYKQMSIGIKREEGMWAGGSGIGSGDDADESMDQGCVVKLRGLPWTATTDDILEFFSDCKIQNGKDGIHLVTTGPGGKSTGEAFIELAMDEDITNFTKKDKQTMGHRYIEVFKVKRAEMEWFLRRSRPSPQSNGTFRGIGSEDCDTFVRLRGLPFECTKEDIHQFFQGLEIVPNGIQLMVDNMGRSSGEAYVQFTSKDQAEKALSQDRQSIGHRYIETFRVGPAELKSIQMLVPPRQGGRPYNNRPSPYDRPGRNQDMGPSRYGPPGGRPARYYSKGFEDDNWNNYGNDTGGWHNRASAPPPPPPLIPGLKRGMGRGGGGGHRSSGSANCVLMRGLPFKANEDNIRQFFEPLVPTSVDIIYESSGRPSGTAKVQFANGDDSMRAMAKHKERMEHRYIELFVHST